MVYLCYTAKHLVIFGNHHPGTCPIINITHGQNKKYWADGQLQQALQNKNDEALKARKKELKKRLFTVVANQTGKLFDPNVLTIVWARRFAEYKRADLLMRNIMRFNNLTSRVSFPVQIIWAGKPYPEDLQGISLFNHLVQTAKRYKNLAVLTGYGMSLSASLKKGADVWLNTPRRPHEASGTSGITAAMNATLNCSVTDGWTPEFARHGDNAFLLPPADINQPVDRQDNADHEALMQLIENEIIPIYYEKPDQWLQMIKTSMQEVTPKFGSDRMVHEYYTKLYAL